MVKGVAAFLSRTFLLIAEPRVIRIIMFFIYGIFAVAGYFVIVKPSASIINVLGEDLPVIFGAFLTFGGVVGLLAVLPGIWWLERTGLISSAVGLLMYLTVVLSTSASSLGFPFAMLILLFLLIRWMEIRRYQLAPRG
ncbi:hypothetical protein [Agreia sp. COWG]|uniref:hypothetical protein n=1 Tax=Agreia sp. COWG TaxID=2773266 RepID=UPI0019257290|nr:hypothetical protein [Agreia sp. COWG]CAD5999173.1 conserved membrane protein of unknown function [Agreia sp. COWG]